MATNPGTVISKWTQGVNSLVPPDAIGVQQYAWGINIVNRGGIIQTRPGFDWLSSLVGVKLQGGAIFTPKDSRPMMVAAVDGYIYSSKLPFTAWTKVDGLKFRSDVPIINFCLVLKSVNVKPEGSIELIDPTPLLIIQDGVTNPGRFDGSVARHLQPDLKETPIGLWMVFTASCLWVFSGSRAYVSDLASPDTFFDGRYLAERTGFELPDEITGAIQTSNDKSILVFTATTTTSFQANIRDRRLWGQTPNFQELVLPTIGCVAGRSPVNQYGLTWWLSAAGFINLDAALQSKISSKLVTVDGRMMRSKRIMSPDPSVASSVYFENFLLLSVPSGGRYNEETWVADQAPQGEADGSGMAWVGVWTGIRPVIWMRSRYNGRVRLFCLAYDATAKDATHIHAHEVFQSDRRDNDGRILCQWETGMFLGTELQRFKYAEVDIVEVLGDVELKVFVGGMRGPWIQIKDTAIQAEIGSIGSESQKIILKESILQAFKPQTRFLKTEEFDPKGKECSAESDDSAGKDKGFQLLFEWRGRMGIKTIKLIAQPDPSAGRGECTKDETGEHNMITEEGATIR